MGVLAAVASWSAQLPPARPHLTVPEPTDAVVAQFTTTSRLTRSVRYGYRRSEPENAASAPAAVTAAVALTARRTTRGKNRDRNIDSMMPGDVSSMAPAQDRRQSFRVSQPGSRGAVRTA